MRGKYRCGATISNPTSPRKSASTTHWSTEQSPRTCDGGAQVRRDQLRVGEFGGLGGAPERLQRADTASHQVPDDRGHQGSGQTVAVVAGFHADRRQQHGVGTDRSGREESGARHGARRRVEREPEARLVTARRRRGEVRLVRFARHGHLPARAPLQHDHRQPGFLLELGVGEVIARRARWTDRPPRTHIAARAWAAARTLRAAAA